MQIQENEALLNRLIQNYFSDSSRFIWLRKGEILIEEGAVNSRLFFVHSGRLSGFVETKDQGREIVFSAAEKNFLGVYSFFSKTYISLATIQAETDCELAYIDKHTKPAADTLCIEKDFMPFAVKDLVKRQHRLLEVSREKQQTQKKLMENQNLASLGQIAAGIAHELNNAISVLAHNTEWLSRQLSMQMEQEPESVFFKTGLNKGRYLSSREVRQHKKKLRADCPLMDANTIAQIAQMGLSEKQASDISRLPKTQINAMYNSWELGAALHDMEVASRQSAHVVQSVKSLGNLQKNRQAGVDLNETIHNALTLLRHKTRDISVRLELDPLPPITANIGEFIQVWTNLIKNACEALHDARSDNAQLTINSECIMGNIRVKIADNGPGIPNEIFSTIFQPNVTTKVSGLSFGLGLGLTIVKRIITEYDGRIDVQSSTNGTSFIIYIPSGGNDV